METPDVRQTFFERGVLFFVNTSAWSGYDKLKPSDIAKQPEEIPDIVRLGSKGLLPENLRVALTSGVRTKVSAFMSRVGTNFKIGENNISGAYLVANNNLIATHEGLLKIRAWLDDMLEKFTVPDETGYSEYDNARLKMIDAYNWLAGAAWPSPEQLKSKYRIVWKVAEITPSEIKEGDVSEIIEAKRKFKEDLDRGFAELRDSILAEAHVSIQEVCENISQRIIETGAVTEMTMKRPKKIVKQYLDIAEAFDDEKIRAQVMELKAAIEGTSAEKIREDWEVAENFANAMKKIGENVGDLSAFGRDGRPKRKVRIDPEPGEERDVV